MAYYSPYQPQMDKQGWNRISTNIGRTVLEKTIIYGAQAIKFIVQFIIDALKSVIGR